ncbi:SDR family oxidoreductase [Dysgonomonas sp. 25]|uniref:SDR family NAD(P)-dependent oxidoreductase n=1 Tax=Dysgonomonas sp. 25 TaxID=2302933 RepID=UPI0013D6C79C|nr:SDR family NAD(P)-dependent oxidoreductase [Dysgonomonas sp. 25]NDV68340.1 SDR family NAD(P)-dependent oxidoreductase [Dysgonomonas sp. 25]
MKLDKRNVVLTGASAGIGLELLKRLVLYPDLKVIAVARHVDNLPVIEDVVYPFAADVSTQKGVDAVFDYAQKVFGEVDVFIANAGFGYAEELKAADWNHIEQIFSLNVFSPVYALERLVAAGGEGEKAFVCTISGAGLAALPYYSLYCSTKAALHHFVETYRYEKPLNLQLSAVYPVATRTAFFDKASQKNKFPLPFPVQDAETVARRIIKGIEKGKKRIYPSRLFRLFYPIGRAFPCLMRLYSLMEKRKTAKYF